MINDPFSALNLKFNLVESLPLILKEYARTEEGKNGYHKKLNTLINN